MHYYRDGDYSKQTQLKSSNKNGYWKSAAAVSSNFIHTGLLLSENCLHHSMVSNLLYTRTSQITDVAGLKQPARPNYYKQLNVHRCNISPVWTGLFLLLLRVCLKKSQNQKHKDCSHLEMYLFECLKLKSKAKLTRAWDRGVKFGNVTTRCDYFTAPAKCLFSTVSGYWPGSDWMRWHTGQHSLHLWQVRLPVWGICRPGVLKLL